MVRKYSKYTHQVIGVGGDDYQNTQEANLLKLDLFLSPLFWFVIWINLLSTAVVPLHSIQP